MLFLFVVEVQPSVFRSYPQVAFRVADDLAHCFSGEIPVGISAIVIGELQERVQEDIQSAEVSAHEHVVFLILEDGVDGIVVQGVFIVIILFVVHESVFDGKVDVQPVFRSDPYIPVGIFGKSPYADLWKPIDADKLIGCCIIIADSFVFRSHPYLAVMIGKEGGDFVRNQRVHVGRVVAETGYFPVFHISTDQSAVHPSEPHLSFAVGGDGGDESGDRLFLIHRERVEPCGLFIVHKRSRSAHIDFSFIILIDDAAEIVQRIYWYEIEIVLVSVVQVHPFVRYHPQAVLLIFEHVPHDSSLFPFAFAWFYFVNSYASPVVFAQSVGSGNPDKSFEILAEGVDGIGW